MEQDLVSLNDQKEGSKTEYVQNNIRDIGLLAVIFLMISLVMILKLLSILVAKTYLTKHSNSPVTEYRRKHIQTTQPCGDPNSSPYMLPVPDLFRPTDTFEADHRRNIDVNRDCKKGKESMNSKSIAITLFTNEYKKCA